jgi:diguanylate cyclase
MDEKEQVDIIPKILIVDDNEKNLIALERILSEISVTAVKSSSGEQALACLMQEEFALVLLDVQMPGMNGFEVAKLMRQNKQFKNIPIIFVTAISKEERYVQEGHEVGAVDYLFKPLDPIILLSKVKVFVEYYIQNKKMQSLVDQLSHTQESLVSSNKQLNKLARFDAVTGLANRLGFMNVLKRELGHAKRFNRGLAVLFLDVDNFKYINDNYGHPAGDELLKQMAARLKQSVRESDFLCYADRKVLISRLGGDEFAIILSEVGDLENAAKAADRIITQLNQPFKVNEKFEMSIGVSIGIACYPLAGSTPESLCKNADMAMYDAKSRGKNMCRFFSTALNEAHHYHVSIEAGLREALKTRQFYLVYQPIVDLETGRTIAVEVLCRCHLNVLKEIPTQDYIHVAEESGLMPELGAWIFSTAVEETKKHLFAIDDKLYVHINISTKQLQDEGFLKFAQTVYKKASVKPEKFTFELTETAIMKDTAFLTKQLNRLSGLGSRISIDDFGTGYSSMVWLRHLPISSLKIDKEFVDEVCSKPNDAVITKSIIRLAENLELTAIAEGIETKEQLEFLKKHQCFLGQGHYFSKPLEMEALLVYLKEQ